jgi:hypothetical protein
MSGEYRARGEDWEMREKWEPDNSGARCLLELRSRVELLEATQHAHLDASQLSEADREAMTEPGRVVTDQPEPAPLATDQDLYQLYDRTGPTVVDAFRAIYDLGRQHGAAQVAPVQSLMERVEALASGDAPVFDPLTNVTGKGVTVEGSFNQDGTTYVFKTAAQPAPSVKDSLTAAPAGSLVERVGKARANARVLGYDEDRAAIRGVAAWLRKNDSEREMGGDAAATADLIEYEAFR